MAGPADCQSLRRLYIHELQDWPGCTWDTERLTDLLADARRKKGRLTGPREARGFDLRQEAVLQTLTADARTSSEIEGEVLDKALVRSSVARRLGLDIGAAKPADRHVEGIVDMMPDATGHYDQRLNEESLFSWHAALYLPGAVARGRSRRDPGVMTARVQCKSFSGQSEESAFIMKHPQPR